MDQTPFPIRDLSCNNKSKYHHFHKGYDPNADDYIQLYDAIEGLIKRGMLDKYVKWGKR